MYGANEGVDGRILTDGAAWQVFHLTGGLPIVIDLAFELDLLGKELPAGQGNNAAAPSAAERPSRRGSAR